MPRNKKKPQERLVKVYHDDVLRTRITFLYHDWMERPVNRYAADIAMFTRDSWIQEQLAFDLRENYPDGNNKNSFPFPFLRGQQWYFRRYNPQWGSLGHVTLHGYTSLALLKKHVKLVEDYLRKFITENEVK